jgi:nitrite reductase/ring-hydroxylating ferredoxin subunit
MAPFIARSAPRRGGASRAENRNRKGTTVAVATDTLSLTTDGYTVAADAAAVPEGRGLLVRIGTFELALFRVGDSIYALENICPHAGGSLAEGVLHDGCVTCPIHGWRFDACTGEGVPPTRISTSNYTTRVANGKVLVRLPPITPPTAEDHGHQ